MGAANEDAARRAAALGRGYSGKRLRSKANSRISHDHDRIHDFNLASGTYRYAGDYTSTYASVSAKPNLDNGYQIHAQYFSYLG